MFYHVLYIYIAIYIVCFICMRLSYPSATNCYYDVTYLLLTICYEYEIICFGQVVTATFCYSVTLLLQHIITATNCYEQERFKYSLLVLQYNYLYYNFKLFHTLIVYWIVLCCHLYII